MVGWMEFRCVNERAFEKFIMMAKCRDTMIMIVCISHGKLRVI